MSLTGYLISIAFLLSARRRAQCNATSKETQRMLVYYLRCIWAWLIWAYCWIWKSNLKLSLRGFRGATLVPNRWDEKSYRVERVHYSHLHGKTTKSNIHKPESIISHMHLVYLHYKFPDLSELLFEFSVKSSSGFSTFISKASFVNLWPGYVQ